jgi:hypothetical protein
MTVIDLIVEQKMILMSIGLAAAPLLLAGLLILVGRLRRSAARRARQKAIAAARAAARQALIDAQVAEIAAAQAAELAAAAAPLVQSAGSPAAAAQDAQEETAQEESEQAAAAPPEIQNILSSVFADDEVSNRYEALLAELPEVDASQLVTMSAQIAQQMRAHHAPDAQS